MATHKKHISKGGEVSYYIRAFDGRDSDGKQIERVMTWKPSKKMSEKAIEKELERQKVLFDEKVKKGLILDGNTKFAEYADKWMNNNKPPQLAPRTFERYKELLITINKAIGHIRLEKLQSHNLQQFYNQLSQDGTNRRTGGGLSQKTILHHHRLISSILGQATRDRIVSFNVADRDYMKAPRVERKEAVYLDDEQAKKVVSLLLNEPIKWKTALLLLIFTGMRRGELMGLEWKDIDFENNLVHIKRTSQYISKQGIITKEPKNKSSERVLKIEDDIFQILTQYKTWWENSRLSMGDKWHMYINRIYANRKIVEEYNDRLFVQEDGLPMHPDSVTDWTEKFVKKHNLTHFSPHSLRHTNITLQIAAGIPLRTVSARAGHAQLSTTGNIYAHAIKTADEKAAKAISDILSFNAKQGD